MVWVNAFKPHLPSGQGCYPFLGSASVVVVVDSLSIVVSIVCGGSVFVPGFVYAVLSFIYSFAITLTGKRVVSFVLIVYLMHCVC